MIIICMLRIFRARTESTSDRLFCTNKDWVFAQRAIFLCTSCPKINGCEMIPLAERTCESGAISNIFQQAIHRFNK